MCPYSKIENKINFRFYDTSSETSEIYKKKNYKGAKFAKTASK